MDAGWAQDPYGRAEQRYHDGTRWTEHVATAGVAGLAPATPAEPHVVAAGAGPLLPPPPPPAVPAPAAPAAPDRSGRLLAAGILTVVESVPALLTGLYLLVSTTTTVGGLVDDATGGIVTFLAVLVLGVGAAVLTVGIGACRRAAWARITTVVLQLLFGAFWVMAGVNALRGPEREASVGGTLAMVAVMVGWVGTTAFLAITGEPRRRRATAGALPAAAA